MDVSPGPAAQVLDYGTLARLSARVVQVVDRDHAFWRAQGPAIDRPRTRLNVLAYVRAGTATLSVDGAVARLRPGTVFHVPAGSAMVIRPAPDDPACFYSMHFWYALVGWRGATPFLLAPGDRPLPIPRVAFVGSDVAVEHAFAHALEVWRNAGGDQEWHAKATLLEILRMVCELVGPRLRTGSPAARAAQAAVDYVRGHLDRPLERAPLARRVGLSPGYFSTAFKQHTGLSFSSYVRAARVSEARRLLHTTGLPVREVARRVGFADPFHFSRVFRAAVGVPPSAFRDM